jgi:alkylation response protein AidB-like acyl-CoA dehydrogenase
VDLNDTPEQARYRAKVRAWLEEHAHEAPVEQGDDEAAYVAAHRAWQGKLAAAGLAAVAWPVDVGGQGLGAVEQVIVNQEINRAGLPGVLDVIGVGMLGPTIIAHGTEEQKARYLRPILAAEEIWCQGFSEPDAGSDLAAVRTRAERRGDVYVVNGQKVWSSFAHIAERCILVTQSDPDAPRYQNLTYLLVDMHAPGVEVRPLRQITGEAEFNEIFFSEVQVPVENRLGEEGEGWQVAMTTLLHERATLGFALTATLDAAFGRLLEEARECEVDPRVREGLAREWIELQALRYTNYRALGTYERTGVPGPEGSGVKLRWSEANQRLTKLARELRGPEGILDDGWWNHQQLRSRGNTIEAGTSEVLRNIISERVLGLPRSR